jgi:CyaY protein
MTSAHPPQHSPDASADLSDLHYQDQVRSILLAIETQLDTWLQNDVTDIDANRSGSMLELRFPLGTQMVINAQAPLKEIWVAARSGGFHFRFSNGSWHDTRSGEPLAEVLSRCASEQAGKALVFEF